MHYRIVDFAIRPVLSGSSCNDDDIQPDVEPIAVNAQAFRNQSFNPVPYDTVTDFLAYADSYSVVRKLIVTHNHNKKLIRFACAEVINIGKFSSLPQGNHLSLPNFFTGKRIPRYRFLADIGTV